MKIKHNYINLITKLRKDVPLKLRKCCAVILNYNDAFRTVHAAESLTQYKCIDDVVVVDNCSTDESLSILADRLTSEKIVLLKTDHNGGYGYGNNYGIKYILKKYSNEPNQILVLIANPDTSIGEDAVRELINCFEENLDCLACSPVQLNPEGHPFPNMAWPISSPVRYIASLTIFGKTLLPSNQYPFFLDSDKRYVEVDCLSGALLMIDANAFMKIGAYHEEMFLFGEETSIGVRSKGKYKSYLSLRGAYMHEHSTSINSEFSNYISQFNILRQSKMYVVKNDYQASGLTLFVCYLLDLLSRIEAPFRAALLRLLGIRANKKMSR